ncbi:hypothetical protein [Lihuaxuella thermophila]|uniref:Uncharacterized protein n=1 Tax=Lihuaxuella thermophila TaxID=1173111 RepID=A0A1H8ABZ3_9BACL|nr:hypothetical protein [Lihuaxuella thermophila]SEM67444.1 hypothetical protein SAMN05444955_10125 [Lihuaxuella thermophila]
MRKLLSWFLKLVSGLLLSGIAWILFVALQQIYYSEPDQVYLMGTTISYAFVYVFLCIVIFFVFSFLKLRFNPDKLKRRFFVFAAFYLVCSPLVILAFDNYLLVTPKGMVYNKFLSVGDGKVKRWREISQVELDYQVTAFPFQRENRVRLRYFVHFKDGPTVDLNHYNSPLYDADQFKAIHRVLLKQGVPVKLKRPLPEKYAKENPFVYEMFHFKQ